MDASVSETDRLWAMMNNLTRVHLLTAEKFQSFDQLIHEYLLLGCEVFDLETGIVSEVDERGNYIVKDVISPLDVLEKNQVFALADTYCNEVVKSLSILGFPEVGRLDYMNGHPVYLNLKLEAYISAPIFVEKELYGTLNFTSTRPRLNGFSSHERDLIELMANAIGNFIRLRRSTDELLELNQRIKSFVGYVAHDLRSPVASIIGLSRIAMKDKITDVQRKDMVQQILSTAESALEFVSTILGNAAVSRGKIELKLKKVNLHSLLQQAQASITALLEASKSTLVIHCHQDIAVHCDDQRIKQVLVNLLTNAAKYSPKNTHIEIAASRQAQSIYLTIKNTVHKVQQREELSSEQTKAYGSTGFGLEIVKDLLKAHESELSLELKDAQFIAAFSLPCST